MNYKQFLKKININLNYSYFISKKDLLKYKIKKEDEEFLNNLFLAPNVDKNSRDRIFKDFMKDSLSIERKRDILATIGNIFTNFDTRLNNTRVKTREYLQYITKSILLDNIEDIFEENKDNIDFIFYFIFSKYSSKNYKDTLKLIDFVLKNSLIVKENRYFNDILLYKLNSLKLAENTYLDKPKKMKEICKLSKAIVGFDFLCIYTQLECKLVEKDFEGFKKVYKENFETMKKWDVLNLLYIFELVVYSKDSEINIITVGLLINKDILLLKNYERRFFDFLLAIWNKDNEKIEFYKNELKDYFDFGHYNFFSNRT